MLLYNCVDIGRRYCVDISKFLDNTTRIKKLSQILFDWTQDDCKYILSHNEKKPKRKGQRLVKSDK